MVIGVGNEFRHDDAAGLEVVQGLRARAGAAGIALGEQEGETLALLEQWDGTDAVVLVDAIRSGVPPGTIHRVEVTSQAIPASLRSSTSTHAVGIGEAIELARTLDRLPGRVLVYGVEGRRFDAGRGLSQEVEAAIGPLSDAVLATARELAA